MSIEIETVAGVTETCDVIRVAVVNSAKKAEGDPKDYGYLKPGKPLP